MIQIHKTYITLPSGAMLSLDATQTFRPNPEFWTLWRSNKSEIKRSGIGVRREERSGQWRGYVQAYTEETRAETHAHCIETARKKAARQVCHPVIVSYDAFQGPRPKVACACFLEYEVVVSACKDGSFQLRLKCTTCDAKQSGAIAWDTFRREDVIDAIAHKVSCEILDAETPSLFDELKGVKWV